MMLKISRILGHFLLNANFLCMVVIIVLMFTGGCGAINVGKWRGIERAAPDEAYYLVNDVFLTASSASSPREIFDHNLNESVHLYFVPKDEKPTYVAESVWQDPEGKNFVPLGQLMTKPERKNKESRERRGVVILAYTPYLRKNSMSTSLECGK